MNNEILSPKQKEYLREATATWNFKTGATRSGKTYMDTLAVIPSRIMSRKGKDGLVLFLGTTEKTLMRNVIEPMQKMFGDLVGNISQNKALMFGEQVWCLGAEKVNQVSKIQGSSIKYCYGDEVATWSSEVFYMLQSRLDKEYSVFDGACNPAHPKHWLKEFIDSGGDIYHQHYTIFDNPFLSKKFVNRLCKEYEGSVFYDRYIKGLWVLAEGAIYRQITDNKERYLIEKSDLPNTLDINIGVDFGKEGSNTTFVASGIHNGVVYSLLSRVEPMSGKTYDQLEEDFRRFIVDFRNIYDYKINQVWCDSAEPTYINSFRHAFPDLPIRGSIKREILERIRARNILLSAERCFFVREHTETLVDALSEAVYMADCLDDIRLDDGTTDIDTLDADEYSWEYYIPHLIRT